MEVAEPSEEKKKRIAGTGYSDDDSKSKKALFLKKLQEASTDTPIYLKKSPQQSPQAPETSNKPSKREIN
jgi:hypothetical protein